MPTLSRLVLVFLVIAGLHGCGNLERQSRSFSAIGNEGRSSTTGITIDASQRAIFSVSRNQRLNGQSTQWQTFCAEPSPDAISALASSFGLDASVASKAIGLAINNQDSTASIGLRTQTIQMLRDAMYRLCEGYAGGALDATGFSRLQRRYQHVMLALLAIEDLTGPVVAQQIALSGSSGVTLGKGLGELSKVLASGAADLAGAKLALADAKASEAALSLQLTSSVAGGSTTAQIADVKALVSSAQDTRKSKETSAAAAKTYYDTLESKLKDAERIVTSASGAAYSFTPSISAPGSTSSSIAIVSQHVKDIVNKVIETDYTKDVCVDVLLDASSEISAAKMEVIGPMCATAFKMTASESASFLGAINRLQGTVKSQSQNAPPPRNPRPD